MSMFIDMCVSYVDYFLTGEMEQMPYDSRVFNVGTQIRVVSHQIIILL